MPVTGNPGKNASRVLVVSGVEFSLLMFSELLKRWFAEML